MGVGKTQLNLTETTIISSVYKGGIIGRKQISLNPSVKIVIDTTKPKIELSDDEKQFGKRKQTQQWISQVQPWMKI